MKSNAGLFLNLLHGLQYAAKLCLLCLEQKCHLYEQLIIHYPIKSNFLIHYEGRVPDLVSSIGNISELHNSPRPQCSVSCRVALIRILNKM